MKKSLVFVSLLLLAAACVTTAPGNKDVTTNVNNANKSAETRSAAAPSESDIRAKETAAWEAVKKKDWDAFTKLMADDYFEVEDDGVHDKAGSLQSVKDFDLSDYTLSDWKMTSIDANAVLITYTANVTAKLKGEPVPGGPYREASAYVNRNGEWLAIYYQETRSEPAMASPTPTKSPEKSASPASTPGETGPDVVANEKLVWDALKSRNFDAFGSYLASDSIEVEPEGVFDHAGTVKGVQMFDSSKAELSDWKTVKLGDSASVVTYTVNNPNMKPPKGYHSTIWVNRNGKWQAFFHQGTPAGSASAAGASPGRALLLAWPLSGQ
jgi:hypothetical protein